MTKITDKQKEEFNKHIQNCYVINNSILLTLKITIAILSIIGFCILQYLFAVSGGGTNTLIKIATGAYLLQLIIHIMALMSTDNLNNKYYDKFVKSTTLYEFIEFLNIVTSILCIMGLTMTGVFFIV